MKKTFILIITILSFGVTFLKVNNEQIIASESENQALFKAAWVSSVVGEGNYTSENNFKNSMNSILDTLEYYGYNALIFHVRTHNNALYPSALNPKASVMSGINFNSFDPLSWLIEATHQRGIEFHAWLNPYRLGTNYLGTMPTENPASNQNNILSKNGTRILNPGLPNVRQFIFDTVNEIIENYDVDAIHFDDYFYIDLGANGSISGSNTILNEPDQNTFIQYNSGYNTSSASAKADWRREQVNLLVEGVYNTIQDFNSVNNKHVQFGISPTGIYKNGNGIVNYDSNGLPLTTGSQTGGQTHYSSYLFADSLKWIGEGWLDYILPQSYWATNHPVAAYGKVMGWWDKVVKHLNVNLYSGIGLYMSLSSTTHAWYSDENQLKTQFEMIEDYENVLGYSVFSYKHVEMGINSSTSLTGKQMSKAYDQRRKMITVLPELKSMTPIYLPEVQNVRFENNKLKWDALDGTKFYYIYKSSNLSYSNDEIVGVVSGNGTTIEYSIEPSSTEEYGVRALSYTNHLGAIPTSNNQIRMVDGASIRTETENVRQGLRFYANIDSSLLNNEFGFYLIYGRINTQTLRNEIVNQGSENLIINNKKVFRKAISNVNHNNQFSVVLTGIPEIGYLDEITAIAYAVDNDENIILAENALTRSVFEVAINSSKEGVTNHSIEQILIYYTTNKKRFFLNIFDKYELTNSLFENNPQIIKEDFIKDWNEFAQTNFADLGQASFFNSAKEGTTDNSNNSGTIKDISNLKIYQFFNGNFYQEKWGWILDYLLSVDNVVHVTRQIEAIKGNGQNQDYLLYNAEHLSYSLVNFFKFEHQSGYYTAIDFTERSKYQTLAQFNDKIYFNLNNYNIYSIEQEITLPAIEEQPEVGYQYLYYDGSNYYHPKTQYLIMGNLEFEIRQVETENNITYHLNGGNFVYSSKELMAEAFLKDFYDYLKPNDSLNDFMHGVDKTSGFDGTWHAVYQNKIYNGSQPIEVDEAYFISTADYMEKWAPFFVMMNNFVNYNPDQNFWGNTYAGLIRLRQYIVGINPGEAVGITPWPEAVMNMMPTPLIEAEPKLFYDYFSDYYLPLPYKEGASFAGWYDNSNFSGEAITVITAGSTGNKTYYAKWN